MQRVSKLLLDQSPMGSSSDRKRSLPRTQLSSERRDAYRSGRILDDQSEDSYQINRKRNPSRSPNYVYTADSRRPAQEYFKPKPFRIFNIPYPQPKKNKYGYDRDAARKRKQQRLMTQQPQRTSFYQIPGSQMTNSKIDISGNVISKTEEDDVLNIKKSEYFEEIYVEVMNESAAAKGTHLVENYELLEIQTKRVDGVRKIKPQLTQQESRVIYSESSIKKRILMEESREKSSNKGSNLQINNLIPTELYYEYGILPGIKATETTIPISSPFPPSIQQINSSNIRQPAQQINSNPNLHIFDSPQQYKRDSKSISHISQHHLPPEIIFDQKPMPVNPPQSQQNSIKQSSIIQHPSSIQQSNSPKHDSQLRQIQSLQQQSLQSAYQLQEHHQHLQYYQQPQVQIAPQQPIPLSNSHAQQLSMQASQQQYQMAPQLSYENQQQSQLQFQPEIHSNVRLQPQLKGIQYTLPPSQPLNQSNLQSQPQSSHPVQPKLIQPQIEVQNQYNIQPQSNLASSFSNQQLQQPQPVPPQLKNSQSQPQSPQKLASQINASEYYAQVPPPVRQGSQLIPSGSGILPQDPHPVPLSPSTSQYTPQFSRRTASNQPAAPAQPTPSMQVASLKPSVISEPHIPALPSHSQLPNLSNLMSSSRLGDEISEENLTTLDKLVEYLEILDEFATNVVEFDLVSSTKQDGLVNFYLYKRFLKEKKQFQGCLRGADNIFNSLDFFEITDEELQDFRKTQECHEMLGLLTEENQNVLVSLKRIIDYLKESFRIFPKANLNLDEDFEYQTIFYLNKEVTNIEECLRDPKIPLTSKAQLKKRHVFLMECLFMIEFFNGRFLKDYQDYSQITEYDAYIKQYYGCFQQELPKYLNRSS